MAVVVLVVFGSFFIPRFVRNKARLYIFCFLCLTELFYQQLHDQVKDIIIIITITIITKHKANCKGDYNNDQFAVPIAGELNAQEQMETTVAAQQAHTSMIAARTDAQQRG